MKLKQIAGMIQEHKNELSSMEIASLIANAINEEWYYQRKDTCELIIEEEK